MAHIHHTLKHIGKREAAALKHALKRFNVRYKFLQALENSPDSATPSILDSVTLITEKSGPPVVKTTFECHSCGSEINVGFVICPACDKNFDNPESAVFSYTTSITAGFEHTNQVPCAFLSDHLKALQEKTAPYSHRKER